MDANSEAKALAFAPMHPLYRCEASRFAACTDDIMDANSEAKALAFVIIT